MPRTKREIERYSRICPKCGKLFFNYVGDEWVYHVQIKYRRADVCSYGCMLKHERGDK
jgi:hypothetical protein